jgi:ankyrin repeat protein
MKTAAKSAVLTMVMLAQASVATAEETASLADVARIRDMYSVEQLLAKGADPNDIGSFATPALHWVVNYGDLELAARMLEAGADPNLRSPATGVTPLSIALSGSNPASVALLLEHGADPNLNVEDGDTPLMHAARTGFPDFVKLLVEHGAEVDSRQPEFGYSPLMLAANAGDLESVEFLLSHGADPNAATTPIGEEVWIKPNGQPGFGNGIGIIRGGTPADRGRRDALQGGMTALLYAARHNYADVAAALLDGGADIQQAEANAIFPLLMAISNANAAVATLLVDRGASVNGADWYGRTPLWEAVNVRNLYVDSETLQNGVERDAMLGVIRLLLDKGADVNARTKETPPFRSFMLGVGSLEWVDFTGQTPFLSAALSGDLTVMKLLLEHDADPFINTYQGTSALMAAAGINWVYYQTYTEGPEQLLAAVKFCHELGMDVNQVNSMGLSALHGAANRGSLDIIEYLVANGGKLDALDNENRSPLDWAKGVFLATHPAEPKPEAMALISSLLQAQGKEIQ